MENRNIDVGIDIGADLQGGWCDSTVLSLGGSSNEKMG